MIFQASWLNKSTAASAAQMLLVHAKPRRRKETAFFRYSFVSSRLRVIKFYTMAAVATEAGR
ncbi:hypothetical protein C8024_17930 [Sphingopyxis sp. BSNA05]|nr:hypothetical protein [Sphingopyxis sp. BSNA05]